MLTDEEALLTAQKKSDRSKQKRVRLTQKAIVEAAAELFATEGFGATSLDDIAETLGSTKGALYYHIRNKEEILRLIYLMVLTACEEPLARIAAADLPPAEKLARAITHQVTVAANRSPAMTVFYREQAHLSGPFAKEIILRKKAYERYYIQIIEEGQRAGVFSPAVDAKIGAFGLLAMCNSLSQWYKSDRSYTPQQVAAMFVQMIERGLVAD